MAGGIGRQLIGGVISKYIGEGGRMSGALGILDNLIKKREEERTYQKDITKTLLGQKEVALGEAKRRGMPFVESEEDIQAKKYRGLQITKAEQDIAGTSVDDARSQAYRVLKGVDPYSSVAMKSNREEYINFIKGQMLGTWKQLPLPDQQAFEEYVGQIWDSYPGKRKISPTKETGSLRQRAIEELKKAGYPTTENNIKNAISQLSK